MVRSCKQMWSSGLGGRSADPVGGSGEQDAFEEAAKHGDGGDISVVRMADGGIVEALLGNGST